MYITLSAFCKGLFGTRIDGNLLCRGRRIPRMLYSASYFPRTTVDCGAQNIFVAPGAGGQISGRVGFGGGATRGQVFVNPAPARRSRPLGFGGRFPVFPNGVVFGSSITAFDLSYERSQLITHFNELAAARAGLNARCRATRRRGAARWCATGMAETLETGSPRQTAGGRSAFQNRKRTGSPRGMIVATRLLA